MITTDNIKERIEIVIAMMHNLQVDIEEYTKAKDMERIEARSNAWKEENEELFEQLGQEPYEMHEIKVFANQLKYARENIKDHANKGIKAMRTIDNKKDVIEK